MVTWCHRNLDTGTKLSPTENLLFSVINSAFALPSWVSIQDYEQLFGTPSPKQKYFYSANDSYCCMQETIISEY